MIPFFPSHNRIAHKVGFCCCALMQRACFEHLAPSLHGWMLRWEIRLKDHSHSPSLDRGQFYRFISYGSRVEGSFVPAKIIIPRMEFRPTTQSPGLKFIGKLHSKGTKDICGCSGASTYYIGNLVGIINPGIAFGFCSDSKIRIPWSILTCFPADPSK